MGASGMTVPCRPAAITRIQRAFTTTCCWPSRHRQVSAATDAALLLSYGTRCHAERDGPPRSTSSLLQRRQRSPSTVAGAWL